jgi:hypothetical protein
MGCQCNCLNKKPEAPEEDFKNIIIKEESNVNENNEMVDNINLGTEFGNKSDLSNEEEDINNLKNKNGNIVKSRNNNFRKIISYDSSLLSQLQEQTESIFEYFEELRTNPGDHQKDAEQHELSELLQKVQDSENPCKTIILNSFLNLLFNSYVNSYNGDDNNDNLIEALEKDEKLKDYNQQLFSVESDISKPNEVIWKLIEDNKDIAYETFFFNDIEYLLISCVKIPESENFRSYFLFLIKKENKKIIEINYSYLERN